MNALALKERATFIMETVSAAAAGKIRLGDLEVNRLGFGAMRLAGEGVWGPPRDPQNARRVLRRAIELDVNFIDTSDAYGPFTNELTIAEALFPYPDELVIATKGGLTRPGPGEWVPDCRPERLKRCCEESLQRLRRDRIDLYQLHAVDHKVPYDEQIGALVELQREGKIRHIGVSNVDVEHLRIACSIATVVSVQNRYNFADRSSEPVLRECERLGIAFIPWFPLLAGDAPENERLREAAHEQRVSVHRYAIAWLLRKSSLMLPIPGTSSLEHLEENVSAATVQLAHLT